MAFNKEERYPTIEGQRSLLSVKISYCIKSQIVAITKSLYNLIGINGYNTLKSDIITAITTTTFKTFLILLSLEINVLIAHKRITSALINIKMVVCDIIINVRV